MKKFGVPLRSSHARHANFRDSDFEGSELRLSRSAGNANAIRVRWVNPMIMMDIIIIIISIITFRHGTGQYTEWKN